MFAEELAKIIDSESKAEQILKDAKAEAKKIMENSRTESRRIIGAAQSQAESISRKYLEEGQKEADKQYEAYIKDVESFGEQMLAGVGDKKEKAIDLIAERIVSNSVSS